MGREVAVELKLLTFQRSQIHKELIVVAIVERVQIVLDRDQLSILASAIQLETFEVKWFEETESGLTRSWISFERMTFKRRSGRSNAKTDVITV